MSKTKQFVAKIHQGGMGGMFVNVPFDVEKEYGKKRVKIIATIDGEKYQGSLVRMGSPDHILIIRKDIREKIGKGLGDDVDVTLKEDLEERVVEVPDDFKKLLNKHKGAKVFFEKLSYSHQREYVKWITEAKKVETRKRRMVKAVDMLNDGKKKK